MSDPAPIERPRTCTRDRGEQRTRLERWLRARFGEAEVSPLAGPSTNGMSSETLLLEARWREGGARRSASLVGRVAPDPAAVPVFPSYDMERQFRVMKTLGELRALPIPRVLWCETDAAALGAPFFVMERVEGDVPPSQTELSAAIEPYFLVEDWHNFGADYDRTLMAWHQRFEAARPELRKRHCERFCRMWSYYLLSCAGSFRARDNQLWQIVLSPGGLAGGYRRPE